MDSIHCHIHSYTCTKVFIQQNTQGIMFPQHYPEFGKETKIKRKKNKDFVYYSLFAFYSRQVKRTKYIYKM